jgi:Ca-activated chloride channel family protein
MSFATPLWFLLLAVIPLVILAQWVSRHRARRYALRFTAVASVLAAAGEPRERWRGWLAPVALLLAVAFLAVALARPRVTHRVPIGNTSIMLVLDHSGSMAADDVSPTRIGAAIKAGNTFIDELPSNVRLGLVGFGSTPDAVQQPVTDHDTVRSLLDSQQADGGTDTGPALALAMQLLDGANKQHPPSAIVLLSDGAANAGTNPVTVAALAKQEKIPIYTVALGTEYGVLSEGPFGPTVSVPPDPQLMGEIAATSGGRAFDAKTSDELSSIYKSLGDKLGSVKRQRDITVWAVIVAAVLLAIGLALSVRSRVRVA